MTDVWDGPHDVFGALCALEVAPAAGRRKEIDAQAHRFDVNGNQQLVVEPNGDRTTNTWDFENLNRRVELPSGTIATHTWNADSHRVSKNVDGTETKMIWHEENILVGTDGADATQVVYTLEPQTYGNVIPERRKDGALWVPKYYHFDALGSARNLTDTSQLITDTWLNASENVAAWVSGFVRHSLIVANANHIITRRKSLHDKRQCHSGQLLFSVFSKDLVMPLAFSSSLVDWANFFSSRRSRAPKKRGRCRGPSIFGWANAYLIGRDSWQFSIASGARMVKELIRVF